jgi:hypothetical protein
VSDEIAKFRDIIGAGGMSEHVSADERSRLTSRHGAANTAPIFFCEKAILLETLLRDSMRRSRRLNVPFDNCGNMKAFQVAPYVYSCFTGRYCSPKFLAL